MARRWGRAPRMTAATLAVAGLVTAAMTGCSALSGSASTSSSGSITLYSSQHEQTTIRDDRRTSPRQTQDQGHGTGRRRGRVGHRRCARRARESPADVFYTENSPPLVSLDRESTCWRRSSPAPWPVPEPSTTPPERGLGGRVGPGGRDRLQHQGAEGVRPAHLRARPLRPEVEGQAGHRSRRDRLPAHRHVDRQGQGHRVRPAVVEGGQGQRRGPTTYTPSNQELDRWPT